MAVDEQTALLLEVVAHDDTSALDREEVRMCILNDAFENEGHIDPNRVRAALPAWVLPQIVGPTYRAMCLEGIIQPAGWGTSDDVRGRNSGKPVRLYKTTD